MPLPPLASLEALGLRLGVSLLDAHDAPTVPDGVRALAALEDASALVRAEGAKSWVDAHDELLLNIPDVIVSITLAVAYRAFRNPDGTTQAAMGDVSVSFSREGIGGSIFLTRAEQRAVRRASGRNMFGSLIMETPFLPNSTDIELAHFAPVDGQPAADWVPMGPFPWEG